MAIESTYRELLIERYIKDQLSRGIIIDSEDIRIALATLIEDTDFSIPQFEADNYKVIESTSSSASKHFSTFNNIRQDLQVLYRDMITLTKVSINAQERWNLESNLIEKKLIDLEDRIENLLLLTQDTEGYHSVIIDNFTDTSQVDSTSTVEVDLKGAVVEMKTSTAGLTRVFLNDLDLAKDLTFKVRSVVDFIGRNDAIGSDLRDPFRQESNSWWTSILTRKAKPITCELTVKIGSIPTPISRIFMELHDSAESSSTQITPLYSVDNVTWVQLPTNTFTQNVKTSAIFSFSEVSATWVRFLLTKNGPDSSNNNFFSYQFGFKQISFSKLGFDSETEQTLISEPLWVIDTDGSPRKFEKLTLEACERIEANTDIKYFITTSNLPTVPLTPTPTWVPISPVGRASPKHPVILTIGDTTETILGDTETVRISYDTSGAVTKNPSDSFQLLSLDALGSVQDDTITVQSGVSRYVFANTNDRILNYQVKDTDYIGSGTGDLAVDINEQNLIVFRNIGARGLDSTDMSTKVREIQRGWKFEEPWYSCVVEIENSSGITMDVGDKAIIIDDVKYTNIIDGTILTGKTRTTTGIHKIKVHKSNWRHVTAGLNTLAALQTADPLYPYNHKFLIEGYSYGGSWPTTTTKVYTGVDLFAEMKMRQVSVFDIIGNVAVDDYSVFALDRDTPDSHQGTGVNDDINNPTRVFVLKVNENNPDFQNERFLIRFSLINQLREYLRLRADFSTEDDKISPALHSYKIKLS